MSADLEEKLRRWNPKILLMFYILVALLIFLQASGYSPISAGMAVVLGLSAYGVYAAMKQYHKNTLRALRNAQRVSAEAIQAEIEELYPPPKS